MLLTHTRSGRGESVVLVHGLGSAATIFKPLVKFLEQRFDVINIDLPGHGQTPLVRGIGMSPQDMGDYVFKTMDELGVERAHLIGNSLGGWIALEMAAARPDRALSVVALAPAGMRETPLSHNDLLLSFNRLLARSLKPFIPVLIPLKFMRAVGFSRNSPLWREWTLETCRDAAEAMAGAKGYNYALKDSLGKVANSTLTIPESVPVVVVFGDTDNILPAKTAQSRVFMPPHGQWLTWENCGHAIQLDYPERVAQLVETLDADRR